MMLMGHVELLHLGDDATSAAGRRVCSTRSRRQKRPVLRTSGDEVAKLLWRVTGEAPSSSLLLFLFGAHRQGIKPQIVNAVANRRSPFVFFPSPFPCRAGNQGNEGASSFAKVCDSALPRRCGFCAATIIALVEIAVQIQ